jgi:hypothetical protein
MVTRSTSVKPLSHFRKNVLAAAGSCRRQRSWRVPWMVRNTAHEALLLRDEYAIPC